MRLSPLALALLTATPTLHAATPARLTVYSGDYDAVVQSDARPGGPGLALYQGEVVFELGGNAQSVALGGLPQGLDVGTVQLQPRGAAKVQGQRFDFALASEDELLRRAIGQPIRVMLDDEANTRVDGILLATGNGLSLRLADGRISVITRHRGFEMARMPSGLVSEPTLSWTLQGQGKQGFELAYATSGMAWRAEYRLDLSGQAKACRMRLDGGALVANRSGRDYTDIALSLVAGEPNRVAAQGPEMLAAAAPRAKSVMADGIASAPSAGEYHAYALPGLASLPANSIQRLPLVGRADAVPCERRYLTGDSGPGWMPPHPIIDRQFGAAEGEQPVRAELSFDNSKAAGLGLPLPAGRVRAFDGGALLGEAALEHTAEGRKVELELGTSFDLSALRERRDFSLDRDGRTMQESIRITLRNAKDSTVTVQVDERMGRWIDWQIVSSSQPSRRSDAQTASFDIAIPAKGEATLDYSVRYVWPADIRLP